MILFPKVALVILNWNGKKYLQQFLPSVIASSYPNLEIVVGDNASTDDSVVFVKKNFPTIRIIQNDKNYGFAEGYNRILAQLEADYFVLLNSDVEVEPSWIEPLIELMENDDRIAAAQPKLLSYANKQLFEYAGAAGGLLDIFGYPFCRGRIFDSIEADTGQYNAIAEIFWASGAAFFIKKKYWDEIGGFDARFFAHMEEIDLCWRLKNKGYKIMYCPDSRVYHVGGGTLSSEHPYKTYLNFRNNLMMLRKNLPLSRSVWIIFIRFWLDLASLVKYGLAGKFKNAAAVSRAHCHFLKSILQSNNPSVDTSNFNHVGIFHQSIALKHFVSKVKHFGDL
ncbi:MAG: glycosyltransferase family 2 protein [Sphingobacteriaceae bacterium]|jgi:GT2 family glycosyltransferase|nr:MAG: glycosyltransferase family 2 protein [Pedobacter sp.]